MRRVHPDKNGTNPDSKLAQQNLADAYAFLQREREREREIEIERETEKQNERERERNKIRVEQREKKRKRENEFNIKREKERRERYEVRDSYTSESYSDDSSIGSLIFLFQLLLTPPSLFRLLIKLFYSLLSRSFSKIFIYSMDCIMLSLVGLNNNLMLSYHSR